MAPGTPRSDAEHEAPAARDVTASDGDPALTPPRGTARTVLDPDSPDPNSLDPESARWVRDLKAGGAVFEDACARLHGILLRIARAEISRRRGSQPVTGPELDDLAHQAAADALVAITRKVGQFRGESKFTTWAFTFVVFEVSGKLGRHFWRTADIALDTEDWERLPDRLGLDPAAEAETGELLVAVRQAVDSVLTPHQRRVFVALVVQGVPLDALVDRLGTNRNAVYKTMFDARRKLRDRLTTLGHLSADPARQS